MAGDPTQIPATAIIPFLNHSCRCIPIVVVSPAAHLHCLRPRSLGSNDLEME